MRVRGGKEEERGRRGGRGKGRGEEGGGERGRKKEASRVEDPAMDVKALEDNRAQSLHFSWA